MTKENKYFILAYYHLATLSDPHGEVLRHKAFFEGRNIRGRIYISEQGINGQMSAIESDAEAYIAWLKSQESFHDITFKVDPYHEHTFPRATVKYREQLVALDREVDLSQRATHVSPQEWRRMLEEEEDVVVIDVRNDYEWKVGHFEGAEQPPHGQFREFDKYAADLKTRIDPTKTKVMMYCTGGIRCELFSPMLKEFGFENLYQLNGGVINYGHQEGGKHWQGKLFVFDDRLTIPLDPTDEKAEVIGQCHQCGCPNESYYNCANMDCNELFLCCPACLDELQGCCKTACMEAPRLRPYHHQQPHKPFQKWYNYAKNKEDLVRK